MFEHLHAHLNALYPTRQWGAVHDETVFEYQSTRESWEGLRDELATELKAAVVLEKGGELDYCDFLHILCVGREPCLMQVLHGDVSLPAELVDQQEGIEEVYLRVALSTLAPLAVVQQVSVSLLPAQADEQNGNRVLLQDIQSGVFAAPLLKRMQKLVAILPAYDLIHLDMGELGGDVEGFDAEAYISQYGSSPSIVNYLFYPGAVREIRSSIISSFS